MHTGVCVCVCLVYALSTVCQQCVCLGRLWAACRLPNQIIKAIIASYASGSSFFSPIIPHNAHTPLLQTHEYDVHTAANCQRLSVLRDNQSAHGQKKSKAALCAGYSGISALLL